MRSESTVFFGHPSVMRETVSIDEKQSGRGEGMSRSEETRTGILRVLVETFDDAFYARPIPRR